MLGRKWGNVKGWNLGPALGEKRAQVASWGKTVVCREATYSGPPHSAGQGHLDGPGELDAIVRCAQFKRILPVPGVTEVVFGTRTSVMLQPTILSGDIYKGSSPVLS